MIYKVFLDNISIYDTSEELSLLSGTADQELNGAGSCEIKLPYNHKYYNLPRPMLSIIDIYEGDDIIWTGRVTDIKTNWNREKTISAEGALAYFNDSLQRPTLPNPWTDVYLSEFWADIIERHNTDPAVGSNGQFVIRTKPGDPGSVENVRVTRSVDYIKTYDVIQEQCIKTNGGYIFISKEKDGNGDFVQYIDWYKELPFINSQNIFFGLNLLDLNTDFVSSDLVTGIIPLGKDENGNRVTVESVNEGSDTLLATAETIEQYGKIIEVVEFNDVSDPVILKEQGQKYLETKQFDHLSIECDVAELALLEKDIKSFKIGQRVHVKSTPHLIDADLAISKISYDFVSPSRKVTIGSPPRQELSEITGNATSGSGSAISGGSGGGGGGGGGGGSTVSVRPIILTGDEIGTITVDGRVYTFKYDASAGLALKADKATTYTKTEVDDLLGVKADTDDVYDKDYIDDNIYTKDETYDQTEIDEALATKMDISEYYTKTELDEIIHEYQLKFLPFKNDHYLVIQSSTPNTWSALQILNMDFTIEYRSQMELKLEAIINIDSDDYTTDTEEYEGKNVDVLSIAGDTAVRFAYLFDDLDMYWYPEQVVHGGKNIINLYYPFNMIDPQAHNIKVLMYIQNGKAEIAANNLRGSLLGTGLDVSGNSGVATGTDSMSMLSFIGMFEEISEDVDYDIVNVTTNDSSDALNQLSFIGMFDQISDSVTVEEGEN